MATISEQLMSHKEEIVSKYLSGISTVKLGTEYACSNASIYLFLRDKCGIEMRKTRDYTIHYDQIKEMHLQGVSGYRIGKTFDIPNGTINRILKDLNLDNSHRSTKRADPVKNHVEEIVLLYRQGNSCGDIAKIYGCTEGSVGVLLRKHGVEMRFHYEIDHCFLDKVNTEEKAYFLGYFTADGTTNKVSKKNGKSFAVTSIDLEIIDKLKTILKYNGVTHSRINPKGGRLIYTIHMSSPQIYENLLRLGCPPNKTFLTKFPTENQVPTHLLRHYIRGLFDGDGSLHMVKKRENWRISIAGNFALIEPMTNFIRSQVDIVGGIYPNGNIFELKIGAQKQVLSFLDWVYKDATIYMERKYQRYKEMQAQYTNVALCV